MSLWAILLIGFLLGLRHATDADHVVAVSTIVARNRTWGVAWLLGAFWGIGHTLTLFTIGVAIILFHVVIPVRLGLSMELAVGVVLILLGILNMAGYSLGTLGIYEHSHPHEAASHHGLSGVAPISADTVHEHSHFHVTEPVWMPSFSSHAGSLQLLRSLGVGLVHGLAGSAAVALLVLASIPTVRGGILYLLIFGVGTLAGMLFLSAIMELGMLYLANFWKKTETVMTFGTGLFSLLFGLYVSYHIGFVDGLFLKNPHWIPR